MKAARFAILTATLAIASGVSAIAANVASSDSSASVAPGLCADSQWMFMLFPDGSSTNFGNEGACVSTIERGQPILRIFGTSGDPGSGNYAYDGIVVDSSGTVEDFVLGAGPAVAQCFFASLFDTSGNLLATASVNSPGQFVVVPLSGVYYQPNPGRASVLFKSNFGGIGGGTC